MKLKNKEVRRAKSEGERLYVSGEKILKILLEIYAEQENVTLEKVEIIKV